MCSKFFCLAMPSVIKSEQTWLISMNYLQKVHSTFVHWIVSEQGQRPIDAIAVGCNGWL